MESISCYIKPPITNSLGGRQTHTQVSQFLDKSNLKEPVMPVSLILNNCNKFCFNLLMYVPLHSVYCLLGTEQLDMMALTL